MLKNNIKNIKEYTQIISSLVGTVGLAIVLKIVDSFMGKDIPVKEYIFMCFVIIVGICALYICISYTVARYITMLNPQYKSNKYPITQKCKYEDNICCANIAIEAIKGDYIFTLNKDIKKKYNLVTENEVLNYEERFRKGEIWIFSYDLTTEVLEDQASSSVKTNLKRGVIYREFYIEDYNDVTGNADSNRRKMEKWYKTEGEEKLFFYPYNNPDSLLNYIFALFGIVLYIKGSEPDIEIDAYFSLRSANTRVKRPIYVKMPYCMVLF